MACAPWPALAAIVLLAVAGCTTPSGEGPPGPSVAAPETPAVGPARDALAACNLNGGICFEPSLAFFAGDLFVAEASGRYMAVSSGDDFLPMPGPPLPSGLPGPWGIRPDGLIQAADGGLWFSALLPGEGEDGRGIQVARSDDGGLTWPVNTVLPGVQNADRQWMAVDGARVWVTYQEVGVGLAAAVSEDGGETFQSPSIVAPGIRISGAPSPDGDGILMPYLSGDGVGVARVTPDGNASLHHASDAGGVFFPSLTRDDGEWVLVWRDFIGSLHVATSPDGETWQPLAAPSVVGVEASPFVSVGPDGLDIVAFVGDGPTDLVVFRGRAGAWSEPAVVAADVPVGNEERPANTDMAWGTRGPDGALHVTWADGEVVRVARVG